jgi:hypothetical protein
MNLITTATSVAGNVNMIAAFCAQLVPQNQKIATRVALIYSNVH